MLRFKRVALCVAAAVAVTLGAYHVAITTERATLVKQTASTSPAVYLIGWAAYAVYSWVTNAEQHDDHVQRYVEHKEGL